MPAVNSRDLQKFTESYGAPATYKHVRDALRDKQLRPEDFSIRELAEELIPEGREFVRLLDPRAKSGGINLLEAADAVSTTHFSNITGQIVFSRIMEAFQSEAFVFGPLVETIPTRFNGEKIPGVGGIGDQASIVAEGKPYPNAGLNEDWIETPATTKRGLIVPVTKEAIFFDQTNLVLRRAGEVGEELGFNKESRIVDCIVDENSTDHRYRWRGAAAIATYQATTPFINLKATNELIDWTDLDGAEQLFASMTDPNTAKPMMVLADTLVVAPQLAHTANRIINATLVALQAGGFATSGNLYRTDSANPLGKTPYSNSYKVVSSRLLASRMATKTSWFLGNIRKAFAYMENWPITVVTAPANSEVEFTHDIVSRFKASERGAAATLEPRAMVKSTVA